MLIVKYYNVKWILFAEYVCKKNELTRALFCGLKGGFELSGHKLQRKNFKEDKVTILQTANHTKFHTYPENRCFGVAVTVGMGNQNM